VMLTLPDLRPRGSSRSNWTSSGQPTGSSWRLPPRNQYVTEKTLGTLARSQCGVEDAALEWIRPAFRQSVLEEEVLKLQNPWH